MTDRSTFLVITGSATTVARLDCLTPPLSFKKMISGVTDYTHTFYLNPTLSNGIISPISGKVKVNKIKVS